jgi:hypothetical protein
MKPPRKLMKRAKDQGWQIHRTRNSHLMWVAPHGEKLYCASTPSDHRAWRNHVARMRRMGYKDGRDSH